MITRVTFDVDDVHGGEKRIPVTAVGSVLSLTVVAGCVLKQLIDCVSGLFVAPTVGIQTGYVGNDLATNSP